MKLIDKVNNFDIIIIFLVLIFIHHSFLALINKCKLFFVSSFNIFKYLHLTCLYFAQIYSVMEILGVFIKNIRKSSFSFIVMKFDKMDNVSSHLNAGTKFEAFKSFAFRILNKNNFFNNLLLTEVKCVYFGDLFSLSYNTLVKSLTINNSSISYTLGGFFLSMDTYLTLQRLLVLKQYIHIYSSVNGKLYINIKAMAYLKLIFLFFYFFFCYCIFFNFGIRLYNYSRLILVSF